jgi:predicted PurR-regulated permease PerM
VERANIPPGQERAAPQLSGESDAPRRRHFVSGWAIAAVLAVLGVLLYEIRIALLPFVFAVAVAFVTDPLIKSVQRRLGSPRWPVAVVCYIVILAILCGIAYWVGSTSFSDLIDVLARAPMISRHFLTEVLGSKGITVFGALYTPEKIEQAMGAMLADVAGFAALKTAAGLAGSIIFGSVLTLVLMPYFMISAPGLAAGALWLLPPERRPSVEELLPKIVPVLRRYLIGLCIVVSYTAVVGWIGFGPIFHLPHAALLAIIVGVLELVPVIGPIASASLVGIIAVQQSGLWTAALLFGFAIALRVSIDNVVGPLVIGGAARIHPVVVIISFTCGAILFGVVGLLIAVPVVVCVKITLQHYYAEPVVREPQNLSPVVEGEC